MVAHKQTAAIISALLVILVLPTRGDYSSDSRAIHISGGEEHTLVLTQNKWAWDGLF